MNFLSVSIQSESKPLLIMNFIINTIVARN